MTDASNVLNGLLLRAAPEDFALLAPHLTRRPFALRDVFILPGKRIEHVYFPESGLVSFVNPGSVQTEVGIVGREGVVGASVLLDVDRMPLKAYAQIAGQGFSMPTAAFLAAVGQSAALRGLMLRYAHTFAIQTASTAYANAHFNVEQRLARWLLMTHDRLDSDDLAITHEFLAMMLCVRRPGVTVATHILEGHHAIRAKRGRITITDRAKLVAMARDSYGMAEAEYDRVLPHAGEQSEPRRVA